MKLASNGSASLKMAICRLRAIGPSSPITPERSAKWRTSPTIARDKGDYLLHTVLGR